MWLDLDAVVLAPDRRPATPASLEAAGIPDADSAALADDVASWWTEHHRELWANTWVARVAGQGHQRLKSPRWPIWDNPPVVTPITGETVGVKYDASEYRVTGACRQLLFRSAGWRWTALLTRGAAEYPLVGLEDPVFRIGPDPDDANILGYRAGFVMPGEVATWTASMEWAVGASTAYGGTAYGWARASDRTVRGLFEVTAGSGVESSEPTWPTTDGNSFVGTNATFTLRLYAEELPRPYKTASLVLAEKLQVIAKGGKCDVDSKSCQAILAMVANSC